MTTAAWLGSPALAPPSLDEPLACAHCTLPVPPALARAEGPAFCCAGCQSVYAIVHAAGLQRYYTDREPALGQATPARLSQRKYEDLDDAAFQESHCRQSADGLQSTELLLEGIHCSACVWLVERLARVVPGVVASRLDLGRAVLEVSWDPARVRLSAVARGLASLGYQPHPTSATAAIAERRAGDRALLLRLGVAGAVAGNVMLMAFALYSGSAESMAPEYRTLFRWASLVLATPSVFWSGSIFLRGAWAALRTRTPHMDVPVSVGLLVGYAGGAWSTLRGSGEVYFDTLCTLVFLLLIGRYLQRSQHRRSSSKTELLTALSPSTARCIEGDTEREVPTNSLEPQALVRVAAGERIPVDGTITRGSAGIDASLLTGESIPSAAGIADRVYAGTTCESGDIWIRVESTGKNTRVGRLLASVEAAQRERAPIVRFADRVAGHFVLGILAIAGLTLLGWWHFDSSHAIDHTIALLVVTCPCALGMATPLAVSAALRQAALAGVLFKGGEHLEALAQPGIMVFDKTGTLTQGQPELLAWDGDETVKPLLRAAEAFSSHPLARSLQRALPANELTCHSVQEQPLGGLRAVVDGKALLVGSAALVESELGTLPAWAAERVQAHAEVGRTPIVIASEGVVRAVAAFGDALRADATQSLLRLAELGYTFHVLSGDHQRVVDNVIKGLGVPLLSARGGVSPEGKLAEVARLRARGERVYMVGDGLNDAGAMAAADVGIAVHGGAEACLSAADVLTTRPGLSRVVEAARGARRTLAVIHRGIWLSLAYNALGIGLAVSGMLNPLVAAVLMPLSSLSVVTLALRARTFTRDPAT